MKKVDTNHRDFPAYKASFEKIMEMDRIETAKAREREGNGLVSGKIKIAQKGAKK